MSFPAAWGIPGMIPKPCDCCSSAAALLYCRSDATFLCGACDIKVHAATKQGGACRHERVWMCEVCEQAPAVVTCKADAAVLCFTCDADIHAANPLSRRHERVPITPFYDTAESVVKSTAASLLAPPINAVVNDDFFVSDVSAGWITSDQKAQADVKSMELVFSEQPDCFLDFEYPVQNHQYSSGADGVVPVQAAMKSQFISPEKPIEIDFSKPNINSFNHNYTAANSLSQSVSSSSMDVGVVPDGSSMSEISYTFGGNLGGGAAASTAASTQAAAPGLDREARVMRYREKRKNRKFEKTIRYASRKAYAETRPRIKGRFAKRTEAVESDDVFCPSATANFFPESRYGVVPSF